MVVCSSIHTIVDINGCVWFDLDLELMVFRSSIYTHLFTSCFFTSCGVGFRQLLELMVG